MPYIIEPALVELEYKARKFLDEYPKSMELRCLSEDLRKEIAAIMTKFSKESTCQQSANLSRC